MTEAAVGDRLMFGTPLTRASRRRGLVLLDRRDAHAGRVHGRRRRRRASRSRSLGVAPLFWLLHAVLAGAQAAPRGGPRAEPDLPRHRDGARRRGRGRRRLHRQPLPLGGRAVRRRRRGARPRRRTRCRSSRSRRCSTTSARSRSPSEILNKPSKLTEDEFELMKTHTDRGPGAARARRRQARPRRRDRALVPRALGRPRLPRRADAARRSRSPRGSCSPATPTAR